MQRKTRSIVLILLIVLMGIIGVFRALTEPPYRPPQSSYNMTVQWVLATNTKVQALIYATQTAKAWTKTPTPQLTQTAKAIKTISAPTATPTR